MTKQTDKQLVEKAIDIKGKKYVLVSDRVLYFSENYPNGCIQTERIESGIEDVEIVKATVIPDCNHPERYFTAYSQAKRGDGFINKQACLENCETSSVGRCLARMGIGVVDSIASVDEINKAENQAKMTAKKEDKKILEEGPFPVESWYDKALKGTKFMTECLDELDFMKKIKARVKEIGETMSDEQEKNLRIAYQNAKAMEKIALSTNQID